MPQLLKDLIFSGFLDCRACRNQLVTPKILPCLDTVCHMCVIDKTQCPVCDQQLTDRGVSNVFIDGLLKLSEARKNEPKPCDYCRYQGRNVIAQFRCLQCADSMCDECGNAHRKTKVTRNHKVLSLKEINSGHYDVALREEQVYMCTEHLEEAVFKYCATCDSLICRRCTDSEHETHEIQSLTDVGAAAKEGLTSLVAGVRDRLPGFAANQVFLSEYKYTIRERQSVTEAEMELRAQELHKAIEVYKKEQIDLLRKTIATEVKEVEIKTSKLRRLIGSMKRACNFVEAMITYGRPEEIMSISRFLHEKLTQCVYMDIDGATDELNLEFLEGNPDNDMLPELFGSLNTHKIPVNPDALTSIGLSDLAASEYAPSVSVRVEAVAADARKPAQDYRLQTPRTMSPSLNSSSAPLEEGDTPIIAKTEHQNSENCPTQIRVNPELLLEFDSKITIDSQNVWPTGVCIYPNGDFYIVDRDNKNVKVFDKSGQYKTHFGSQNGIGDLKFSNPCDIAVDVEGDLLVTDYQLEQVKVFNISGKLVKTYSGTFKQPRGIYVTASGEFALVDGHSRQLSFHRASDGGVIRVVKDARGKKAIFKDPYYVAVATTGKRIAVSDWAVPNLKILSDDGRLLNEQDGFFGTVPGKSMQPYGVIIDNNGYILMADNGNHRVNLLSPDGKFIRHLVSRQHGLWRPMALAIDNNGNLVITEALGKVKIFNYM